MKIEGESYMPKHIGKYSLLASTLIRELVHEDQLFYIFLFIDRGDTKEHLLSYGDDNYQYVLEIDGRGEAMRFRGEKQRAVYVPYFGPIHYEKLETVYFEFEDIPSVTKKFIQWIERNMKQYGY